MTDTPYVSTNGATKVLETLGLKRAPSTLNKARVVGGGPPFVRFGRNVFYPRQPLIAWATGQLSQEVRSTSELPSTSRAA
jgi:hypothetical protein